MPSPKHHQLRLSRSTDHLNQPYLKIEQMQHYPSCELEAVIWWHKIQPVLLCAWTKPHPPESKNLHHTVDRRNPAPVEVGSLPHYLRGFIHLRWLAGFLSSTVSQVAWSTNQPLASGMIFYTRTSLDKNSTIRPQLRSFKNFIFRPFFWGGLGTNMKKPNEIGRPWFPKTTFHWVLFLLPPQKKHWQFTLPYSLNSASFMSYKFLSTTHQDLHFRPRCMTNCHDKWAVCKKKPMIAPSWLVWKLVNLQKFAGHRWADPIISNDSSFQACQI